DDLVRPLVLDVFHGRDERVRMRDLPVDLETLGAEDRERGAHPALRLGMLAVGRVALRADDEECRGPFGSTGTNPVEERLSQHPLARRDEDGCSPPAPPTPAWWGPARPSPPALPLTSETMCSPGRSPAALRISSTRFLRSHPDFVSGCAQTRISSMSSHAS